MKYLSKKDVVEFTQELPELHIFKPPILHSMCCFALDSDMRIEYESYTRRSWFCIFGIQNILLKGQAQCKMVSCKCAMHQPLDDISQSIRLPSVLFIEDRIYCIAYMAVLY